MYVTLYESEISSRLGQNGLFGRNVTHRNVGKLNILTITGSCVVQGRLINPTIT